VSTLKRICECLVFVCVCIYDCGAETLYHDLFTLVWFECVDVVCVIAVQTPAHDFCCPHKPVLANINRPYCFLILIS